MKARASLLLLAVVAAAAALLPSVVAIPLTPALCEDERRLRMPERVQDAPMQDLCSLCQQIMRNRYKWDFMRHPESLLTSTPSHVREWGEYFACSAMKTCQNFQSGSCKVSKADTTRPVSADQKEMIMTPCRPEYLCYTCFKNVFNQQLAGCLDSTYFW